MGISWTLSKMFSLLRPYETPIRHLLELFTLSFVSLNPALCSLLLKLYCIMHNSFISVLHFTDFPPQSCSISYPIQWIFYFWKLFCLFTTVVFLFIILCSLLIFFKLVSLDVLNLPFIYSLIISEFFTVLILLLAVSGWQFLMIYYDISL